MTMPLIDSHVHLWNPRRFPLSWLEGDALLEQPYELEAYEAEAAAQGIAGIVYVETGVAPEFALLEAQFVTSLAERTPLLKGIVAHAPLEYGARSRNYLDALAELGPKVKGVRRNLQEETAPDFCLTNDFLTGVRLLPEYGFSFDICIKHPQLPAATELVRRCPETTFILDHLGKPNAKAGELDPWRDTIYALAELPNVACKLSGLVTEADPEAWTPATLEPYVTHVLECFGERVMFGSDWPVMHRAADFQGWLSTVRALTQGLNDDALDQLFHGAATRWYRLQT